MSELRQMPLFDVAEEASPMTAIEGFLYLLNFITPQFEQSLIEHIDQQPWDTAWKRRVQQYGSSYGKTRPSQATIPSWLMSLCERLAEEGFFPEVPNLIIVNEYMPGQGIAPHSDHLTSGNIVASLSLAAPIVMDFINPKEKKLSHLLERRSLFVLSGPARYDWKHGIAPRKADKYQGTEFTRRRRVSCTFRNALPDKSWPA